MKYVDIHCYMFLILSVKVKLSSMPYRWKS